MFLHNLQDLLIRKNFVWILRATYTKVSKFNFISFEKGVYFQVVSSLNERF